MSGPSVTGSTGRRASVNSTSSSRSSRPGRRPMVASTESRTGKGSEMAQTNQTSLELRGDREFVIERTFNGPPRIVFDAYTRPELVQRWWAPRFLGDVMLDCQADVRPGGHYRYV